MSSNTSEKEPGGGDLLREEQSVVGVTRHRTTGAYIVWMSLEGNDVTPIGAWQSETAADEAMQETAEEFHRLVDAMDRAAVEGAEQANEAGFNHWTAFVQDMKKRSDAPVTPFGPAQLTEIGTNMAVLMGQRKKVPDAPDGFARVLLYSNEALAGLTMPRVRLAPMKTPPRKNPHNKNKGSRPQP